MNFLDNTDYSVRVIGTTPKGKQVGWRPVKDSTLMEIAFVEGGELPKELKSKFSNLDSLKGFIMSYIAKLENEAMPKEVDPHKEAVKAAKKRPDKLNAKEK